MALLGLSFLAGILTVLAPCVLPLLPVIIGGSVKDGKKSHPGIIIASFAVSVLLFTIAIKFLADNLGIFPDDISKVSAVILILFGIFLLFPNLWSKVMHKTGLENKTNKAQQTTKSGVAGDIILGVVLGPVFNTCSPTYAILVATILPINFGRGIVNILAYVLGLVIVLSAIAYGGRAVVSKLKRAANPNGRFKKTIALLLILIGVAILMKRDKAVETRLYDQGLVFDTTQREVNQLDTVEDMMEQ